MEYSRIETFNSYLFLRNILGFTNKQKDEPFLIGIRYTGSQILAMNENSTKLVLLLEKSSLLRRWFSSPLYPELMPISEHLRSAVEGSSNPFLSEVAFDALKELVNYSF